MVTHRKFEDYEVIDDEQLKTQGGVLRDRQRMVVASFMMDSALQDTLRAKYPPQATPAYRGRPGFATMPVGDSEQRAKLYADSDKKLSERWRSPPPVTQDAAAKPAAPTPPTKQMDMAPLYDRRDKALSERWRGAK